MVTIYHPSDLNISFSNRDLAIFAKIKTIAEKYNTTARVAGGYIRDKILYLDSNDIDITVDNMTGEEFARLLSGKVSVVEANPEQSKHLATAMVRIHGLPIDFTNLRTETYTDSRIPEMKFGTPEEDALRRDLTINALFYNIHTGDVEDFVGGLDDLKQLFARTPTDPVQTFLDDPLRILRTIRFAARFNMVLDDALVAAARKPEVQESFRNKISNERIWAELAGKREGDKTKPGLLNGPDPIYAMNLLDRLGLLEIIFDPTSSEMQELGFTQPMVPWNTDQNNQHHAFSILEHTKHVFESLVERTSQDIKDDKELFLIRNLAGLLHDIGKRYTGIHGTSSNGQTNYHNHEEVSAKIVEVVLNRLHAPKDVTRRVMVLIDRHLRPHMLLADGSARACRKFVRDFEDWEHSIDLAIADNLGKKLFSENEIEQEVQRYENLRTKIRESMPTGVTTNLPRPINGKDLIGLGIKPGPIMGQIMNAIDEALLENPGLGRDEAFSIARTFM